MHTDYRNFTGVRAVFCKRVKRVLKEPLIRLPQYPLRLTTFASSPKGTPYGNAENFVAAAKSRPLGQTLPGRGEMSR